MAEQNHFAALAAWFAQHPHQRPPAQGATIGLRVFLADLELRTHKGTLTADQQAAIARWQLPIGKGQLLTVGEEWVLLRRIANVKALGAQLGGIRGAHEHRLPADLQLWIAEMRQRRQENPGDPAVQLVSRLDPRFPWRESAWRATCAWLKQRMQRLTRRLRARYAPPLAVGPSAPIDYRT